LVRLAFGAFGEVEAVVLDVVEELAPFAIERIGDFLDEALWEQAGV